MVSHLHFTYLLSHISSSWPKGESVNDGVSKDLYLRTSYTLYYPSIDNITAALRRLGPGAKIFKIDIYAKHFGT